MADLPPVSIDFETYYDKDYSLKKLDVVQYVHDKRFEVIGFSYHEAGQPTKWHSGPKEELSLLLMSLRLDQREVRCHHAMFDGAILEWVFKIKPKRYLCTMMASRPFVVPIRGRADLRTCAKYFGLPDKGDFAETKAKGKRREGFNQFELAEYGEYCKQDDMLCSWIAAHVSQKLPPDELDLIDLTIKKFLRPRLVIDKAMLEEAKAEVETEEAHAVLSLASLGFKREVVTSNPQFAAALTGFGVPIPKKISPTTGRPTPAFAKKDPGFLALKEHSDPRVRQLVEARLKLKSSINRTRLDSFLQILELTPCMPVPLLYYGAHTGRFSGFMGINMQNLPKKSALRKALRAPRGYKVIVADLAAIEARITAALADCMRMVMAFTAGADVYSEFGTELYGYEVTNSVATETERFVAKTCILGLGFGMGYRKFKQTMDSAGIPMTYEKAKEIVDFYRRLYREIPQLWRKFDKMIKYMASLPINDQAWHGFPDIATTPLLKFRRDSVELPNGMKIHYPGLACPTDPDHYVYSSMDYDGRTQINIWGGALTENIVQALARIIISRAEVRLARAGLVSVMQVHDELVFVVPEHTVETIKPVIQRVLTDPVPWMPNLPIACSIGVGDSYGEAK